MVPTELVPALLFREYLKNRRQALLMEVDNIERMLDLHPRTAELRKAEKERQYTNADGSVRIPADRRKELLDEQVTSITNSNHVKGVTASSGDPVTTAG